MSEVYILQNILSSRSAAENHGDCETLPHPIPRQGKVPGGEAFEVKGADSTENSEEPQKSSEPHAGQ